MSYLLVGTLDDCEAEQESVQWCLRVAPGRRLETPSTRHRNPRADVGRRSHPPVRARRPGALAPACRSTGEGLLPFARKGRRGVRHRQNRIAESS